MGWLRGGFFIIKYELRPSPFGGGLISILVSPNKYYINPLPLKQ
jgi:hypothetical protein